MRAPAETTLGTRFLLIVLLAAVIPLGLTGAWLSRDAGRTGEAMLEQRMIRSLEGLAREMGAHWIQARSALLDLAESPDVLVRLGHGAGTPGGADPLNLADRAGGLAETVHGVSIRDRRGVIVARYDAPGPRRGSGLPVTLPVHAPLSGERLGEVEARLALDRLLVRAPEWMARAGGVLGVLEPGGGASLLPAPFSARHFADRRFTLDGEEWVTVRLPLTEPAVVLAMAAPLEPFTVPFREAARRGVLILLAVALAGVGAAAVLTRQVTRPVRDLASASRAVADGELDRTVEVRGPQEIRQLARAFNTMAANLQDTLDTLAKREALAAVGEFAAGLAHELRNPLTAIRLDLQRVEEVSDDEERQRALLNRMLKAVRRLDRTVSGVLRLAGSGQLRLEPVSLTEPLEVAMQTARATIADRGGELAGPELPAGTDLRVSADPRALEQLFLNLLLNAAEALEPDQERARRVEVSIQPGRRGRFVEVRIRDTGRGIPPDVVDRIFEPLFTTKTGGTGLGLVIARRIARAHGGEIHVTSHDGSGTTVRVELPAANGASARTRPLPTHPAAAAVLDRPVT